MRRPRFRRRPALGDWAFPTPVIYSAVAIAVGAVLLQLMPKRRRSYRGY